MNHETKSNNITDAAYLKKQYVSAAALGDTPLMVSLAQKLLASHATLGVAQQIINTLQASLPGRQAIHLRVAFLRSYTVEPVLPFLKALALLYGIELTVRVGEFNSYVQEIIDPASWLYDFDPHVVVLAVQTRDILPGVWSGSSNLREEGLDPIAQFVSLVDSLRSRSQASFVFQSLEQPVYESNGLLDGRAECGQAETIRMKNAQLFAAARNREGVYVLDYDGLVARHGRERWSDERKWLTTRLPIAADNLILMAREYLRLLVPLAGRQGKVLVTDLDNTLWGGVIGEDGLHGIKIDSEYPGAAFLNLHRTIKDIGSRGVLLAICSKNNEADVWEVFDSRSEMLLKRSDFSACRINWTDKAQNLREIAAELNVGTDSLVFLDDNPVERERVELELPEVTVIDLPADPMGYARALRSCPVFERLDLTSEDRDRGRYYAEQRERKELEISTGSLEDFYKSLHMRAEVVEVTAESVTRIAQLTQKTNQLNMTTRRYTEPEVLALAGRNDWRIFGMKVQDKFGDNGIVGVVFLNFDGDRHEVTVDNFMLSCRVIGRTVETAMLSEIEDFARKAHCKAINGWFLPTAKNDPAKAIYEGHGFISVEENEKGILWRFDLTENKITRPPWIS